MTERFSAMEPGLVADRGLGNSGEATPSRPVVAARIAAGYDLRFGRMGDLVTTLGKDDVAAIAAIDVVPRLLDVCGKITGMGFTAIARVTEHQWIACAVRDNGGTRLLGRMTLEPNAQTIVGHMQKSVSRMFGLIEDILDFARGRLGGGIPLNARSCDLAEPLLATLSEFKLTRPDRDIRAIVNLDRPVDCDPARIAQLFTNLLRNALTHGDPDKPVLITANIDEGRFRLVVSNSGPPIPASLSTTLFQPFKRADRSEGQGLGLGLFIAAEIANAHGGNLTLTSNEQQTSFLFTMPVEQ